MFIDEVVVEVTGGKGGNGMASFRREKYVEFGGPWGGNGGKGGDIVFIGEEGKSTLIDLKYQRHIKGFNGVNGMSKGMHGANAEDKIVKVPLGTVCYNFETGQKIGEILEHGQRLVVAKGGRGGRGNMALATRINHTPSFAENGDLGEKLKVKVELKVLADVGVVGYPSVGKSTLISVVSNARPKIADYPFTTLQPNLGMVYYKDESFVLADLPGLIEGAHRGEGLGIRFLKHIERCKIFIHLIDLSRENPYEDYLKINDELRLYSEKLSKRHQIIVLNKIDMVTPEKIAEFKKHFKDEQIFEISALTKQGLDALLNQVLEDLKTYAIVEEDEVEEVAYYKLETEEPDFILEEIDGVFCITGKKVEQFFMRTEFTKEEAVKRFARQLRSIGVDDALRNAGAKNGDTVRIFEYEFEFID